MSEHKFLVTNDRILVKAETKEEKTSSGFYIPENKTNEQAIRGVAIAIGPGIKDVTTEVNKGDKIVFNKFGGTAIELDGEKYLIIKFSDVYLILNEQVLQ